MIVFDLKIILFILLLMISGCFLLVLHFRSRYPGWKRSADTTMLEALSFAPFGVIILEADRILFCNEFASNLLHLTPGIDQIPDTDWLPMLREDCAAAHQNDAYKGRFRIVTFASGQTARWWIIPILQRDVVFLFDITSQIRTEQAGKALVNDLGHELRTPVATILTHLEILGLEAVGVEAHQQSLDLARSEAQRMGRLINDMLELGRLEITDEIPLRPMNLLPLVNDIILQLTSEAQNKHMVLSLDADADIPLIVGNADRLRQVFLNLVDNAIKYATADGRVTITLKSEANGVKCSVCDNGPGIASEDLPYITRRFYRASPPSVEGSGLGLALVTEILRRHQSQLIIESPVKDAIGTCMHFQLPINTV